MKAHAGKFRRDGVTPAIMHPMRVAQRVAKYDVPGLIGIAWLHDVLEDSSYLASDLLRADIPPTVVVAVETLTHKGSESYDAYIEHVCATPETRLVKLHDVLDNLADNPTVQQIKKYARALSELTKGMTNYDDGRGSVGMA